MLDRALPMPLTAVLVVARRQPMPRPRHVATGYENQQEFVRAHLGEAVADRIGPVWGFDDGGELRNMWTRTAQDGLWFTAGSLAQCRIYSRYLALQIKALEDGLLR
jgi:putative flavoprotein involved in K+ transport